MNCNEDHGSDTGRYVSIPFKREGTCELERHGSSVTRFYLFQFPSNGKVHVNSISKEIAKAQVAKVSIPFKREGTCELLNRDY